MAKFEVKFDQHSKRRVTCIVEAENEQDAITRSQDPSNWLADDEMDAEDEITSEENHKVTRYNEEEDNFGVVACEEDPDCDDSDDDEGYF